MHGRALRFPVIILKAIMILMYNWCVDLFYRPT